MREADGICKPAKKNSRIISNAEFDKVQPIMRRMRDRDIRPILTRTLAEEYVGDPGTAILEELPVGAALNARIDVVLVNGSLHGYEIKADRDTLSRLPSQAAFYNRAFDLMTLVAGSRHLREARAMVPRWWGIIEAVDRNGAFELRALRKPRVNPQVEPLQAVSLLRNSEVYECLRERELHRRLGGRACLQMYRRLFDSLCSEEILSAVRVRLKARR